MTNLDDKHGKLSKPSRVYEYPTGDNNSTIFQVFSQFLDVPCVQFLNTELLFAFIWPVGHD